MTAFTAAATSRRLTVEFRFIVRILRSVVFMTSFYRSPTYGAGLPGYLLAPSSMSSTAWPISVGWCTSGQKLLITTTPRASSGASAM